MKIGIAFDLAPTDLTLRSDGPDDRFEEFDKPETVEAIAEVIRGEGHDVITLGDGREFLTRVLADPPDFVFNIAEGEGVGRSREARVPAVLEMLGIPYSGSDPLTLAASLDKVMAKRLVQTGSDVQCPRGWTLPIDDSEAGDAILGLLFDGSDPVGRWGESDSAPPLILKPAFEGSSKGIRGRLRRLERRGGDLDLSRPGPRLPPTHPGRGVHCRRRGDGRPGRQQCPDAGRELLRDRRDAHPSQAA